MEKAAAPKAAVATKSGRGVAHVPLGEERERVMLAVAHGVSHEVIAKILGISVDTLTAKYDYELKHGLGWALEQAANTLYLRGTRGGDTTALIFWLKARGKWVDRERIEVTGKDGGAIEIEDRRGLVSAILSRRKAKQAEPA